MQQRLFRAFLLATIPWILLLGVVANFWIESANGSRESIFLWTKLTAVSAGVQATIALILTLVILIIALLAKVTVRPFSSLLRQLNLISSQGASLSPELTGLDEVDETLKVLFSQANTAQRRLDSERTLAADVSHQLRSPLTALSLRLEQIAISTTGTHIHEEAQAALGQVDRLVNLVEGLLKTWRATSDRNLTQINISTFLIEVKQLWQSRLTASGREMELNCESDLIALGTYDVQEQVLSVLIENAIQHGAGKITISAKDYQAWVLIEVSDEGQGIAREIENSLMAKGSTTSGNGLGLAWARNQVASDGGRLELRSIKPAVFGIFLIAEHSLGA
ncbi:MAG: hypothetical protein RL741_774 [Actinomycetota bacterium]|jgi:signal transduction histidine kinase